jgi:arylsulfatase A-like enzyme
MSIERNIYAAESSNESVPNIVLILADDLGYGDVGCYGATKVQTPNIDRLARQGRRFTDAHSPSSVCTPTRYNLLTGRYCWRTWARTSCVWSSDPLLIDTERLTLPALLKRHGYRTACIGKWHLGFGRPGAEGWDDELGPDYNRPLQPGPLEIGFDSFFGIPHVGQFPHVYIRDHEILGRGPGDQIRLILDKDEAWHLPYPQRPRVGRTPAHRFEGTEDFQYAHEDLAIRLTEEAVGWLKHQQHATEPFFLYFAHRNVHGPIKPNQQFRGTSPIGAYGDFIHELDWSVGQVLGALDRLGLTEKTIVFFSSDNGAVERGYRPTEFVDYDGHRANGPWRGQKTEIYEGGHRVPLIARWPQHVAAGSQSDQLVALTDTMATVAELLGDTLPAEAGEDSFSFLPALLARDATGPVRQSIVNDSYTGEMAIREGPWKLILAQHGGGIGARDHQPDPERPPAQLFRLDQDPTESTNLYASQPAKVAQLKQLLQRIQDSGRSRP